MIETSDLNLINILNQATVKPKTKNYIYNQMEGINSKPELQEGSENLREYSLDLSLHYLIHNPKKITDLIEEYASSREPFDWVYKKEYKGQFVIDEVEIKQERFLGDVLIYAQIGINLLEYPQDNTYSDQTPKTPDLSNIEQFEENSNKFQEFKQIVKTSIEENVKSALSGDLTVSDTLSEAAKEIFESVRLDCISQISKGNTTQIYNTITNALKHLETSNLNLTDLSELKSAIKNLGELTLQNYLRSTK